MMTAGLAAHVDKQDQVSSFADLSLDDQALAWRSWSIKQGDFADRHGGFRVRRAWSGTAILSGTKHWSRGGLSPILVRPIVFVRALGDFAMGEGRREFVSEARSITRKTG
ncbi:MAG: hypothetical protein R3B96_15090 [Pirellulaceae bacterium]